MNIYSTLKELCRVSAVSGREGGICSFIKEKIEKYVDCVSVDTLGNLIACKKGRDSARKLMLCAHMDEIGFIVNFIEDSGLLRVAAIGGVDFASRAYSRVVSESGVAGVLVPEDCTKPADIKADKCYIDIGAKSKKEAERKARIGDFFVAREELFRLGSSRVSGKALDDRVGCLVLLEVARRLGNESLEYDVYFVFSVQEEVGCRGSRTATYAIAPTEAICIDVTRTGDVPGAKPMACALGKGVAIKVKDSSVICSEQIVSALSDVAKKEGIRTQMEILEGGGTDTSSMQMIGAGSLAGALSIPTRYIHTGVETCDLSDVEACVELLYKYILTKV